MKKFTAFAATILILLIVCGCHHPYDRYPEAHPEPWTPSDVEMMLGGEDPMEGFNRSMFAVSEFGVLYVVRPVGWLSEAYVRRGSRRASAGGYRYGLGGNAPPRLHPRRRRSDHGATCQRVCAAGGE